MSPVIHLQLLFFRARWQRACEEAMYEHRRGRLSEETMQRVEELERHHRILHAVILETLR